MKRIRHTMTNRLGRAAALVLGVLLVAGTAQADPRERDSGRGGDAHRSGPPARVSPAPQRAETQRWYDGAHGHNHYYPRPGWAVRSLPPRASITFWGGVGYNYFDGIWYTGGPHGYVVVRPPIGIVITDRPALATVLAIGGLTYLYANGVYYREHPGGGYEVVPPPVEGGVVDATLPRSFVYPRQGQTAAQQATDEYECHQWAVGQTGFDPTNAATGQPTAMPARRGDYERARGACLDARGYTVR